MGALHSMIIATLAAMTPYGVGHARAADFVPSVSAPRAYPLRGRSLGDRARKQWKRRRASGRA